MIVPDSHTSDENSCTITTFAQRNAPESPYMVNDFSLKSPVSCSWHCLLQTTWHMSNCRRWWASPSGGVKQKWFIWQFYEWFVWEMNMIFYGYMCALYCPNLDKPIRKERENKRRWKFPCRAEWKGKSFQPEYKFFPRVSCPTDITSRTIKTCPLCKS